MKSKINHFIVDLQELSDVYTFSSVEYKEINDIINKLKILVARI